MAELLVDVEADSPWLYYRPTIEQEYDIVLGLHQPSCTHLEAFHVHKLGDVSLQPGALPERRLTLEEEDDIKHQVNEYCGLAGVIPLSRDTFEWDGGVVFRREHGVTTAVISYALENSGDDSAEGLLKRLKNIGYRLRNAYGLLQQKGVCCDSFTVVGTLPFIGTNATLELNRIDANAMLEILNVLDRRQHDDPVDDLYAVSRAILQMVQRGWVLSPGSGIFDGVFDDRSRAYHYAALALQFLCLGLCSYLRGHSGATHPFFLVEEVHRLVLLGNWPLPTRDQPLATWSELGSLEGIDAQLVDLTCLSGLVQNSVIAFEPCRTITNHNRFAGNSFDVLATPADLVETWGPGLLIRKLTNDTEDSNNAGACLVHGIDIGGGLLTRSADSPRLLHWQLLFYGQEVHVNTPPFALDIKIRIGAAQINHACRLRSPDELDSLRQAYDDDLHELGTSAARWKLKTVSVGLQGGQFALLQGGVEFENLPCKTIKDRMLRRIRSTHPQIFIDDLNAFWGLEISLCTGVARRVPLRLLLAEALPAFVSSTITGWPEWDKHGNGLVTALSGPDLNTWFSYLQAERRGYVERLLGMLIVHLSDTGLNDEDELTVAWISPYEVQRCFKLRCDESNSWAKILKDTEHCATFACVTTACIEIGDIRCQGKNPGHWRNVSELLTTEICRYSASTSSSNHAMQPRQPFALEDNRKYWIGPLDAGLVASASLANPPILYISQDRLHIPKKYMSRVTQKLRERVRERGSAKGQTVLVAIRAHRTH